MPDGLSLDEKVRWCLGQGMSSPGDISKEIAEDRPVVLGSLSRQTSVGKLEAYEQKNGQTGWRIKKRAARAIPAVDPNDAMEETQWLN